MHTVHPILLSWGNKETHTSFGSESLGKQSLGRPRRLSG
jgi:hypothetical protein